MAVRNISRVTPKTSALLVCDVQERFRLTVKFFTEITKTTKRLMDAARILEMKIIVTAHNPSVCVYWSLCAHLVTINLICDSETHVCILQTALDLFERGIQVHVVIDASLACYRTEKLFGFRLLQQAGAILTTSEALIMELCGGIDHPKSQEIVELIKEPVLDTGLANFAV